MFVVFMQMVIMIYPSPGKHEHTRCKTGRTGPFEHEYLELNFASRAMITVAVGRIGCTGLDIISTSSKKKLDQL